MVKKKNYLLFSFLLSTSMLYLSYIVDNLNNIKYIEVLIFIVLLVLYLGMPKINIEKGPKETLYKTMVAFGIVYLLRALWDLGVAGESQTLFTNDSTVYFYIINGMIIPLIFLPRAKIQVDFKWAYFFTAIVLLFALFYSVDKFINSAVQQAYRDQMFGANDNISVIEYGHLGLTAAIMGAVLFMKRKEKRLFFYCSIPLMLIGIISIFLSGTRSAMVGLIFIFAIYAIATFKRKTLIPFVIFLFIFVYYSENIIEFADSFGVGGSVSRIFRLINESGDQSSGRSTIWAYALKQCWSSPVFGISCFFHTLDADVHYVHNSVIEVFYALGLVGVIIFIIFNIIAIRTCIRIFKSQNTNLVCFALLYLQYFTLSLFSNSILRLPLYWYFFSMVMCIHFNGLVDKKKVHRPKVSTNNTEQPPVVPVTTQQLDPQKS